MGQWDWEVDVSEIGGCMGLGIAMSTGRDAYRHGHVRSRVWSRRMGMCIGTAVVHVLALVQ